MKNIKPIFIFTAFLSGMLSSTGVCADSGKVKALELLPALYSSGDAGSNQIEFLDEKPLIVGVESYSLDPMNLKVSISIPKERAKPLLKLTDKYEDKRLAVVSNSGLISSPEISIEVMAGQMDISLNSEREYSEFVKLLGSE